MTKGEAPPMTANRIPVTPVPHFTGTGTRLRPADMRPEPVKCSQCGDEIAPRQQHGPNATMAWAIDVDEYGRCATCVFLAEAA